MFHAAVAFFIGILAGTYLRPSPRVWLALFCAVTCYAILCAFTRLQFAFWVALFGLACAGALQTQLALFQQEPLPDLTRLTSDSVTITGHVVRSGLLRESSA